MQDGRIRNNQNKGLKMHHITKDAITVKALLLHPVKFMAGIKEMKTKIEVENELVDDGYLLDIWCVVEGQHGFNDSTIELQEGVRLYGEW